MTKPTKASAVDKSTSPVIRREKRITGLKVYEHVSIDLTAHDPNPKRTIKEAMRLFKFASPKERLAAVQKRATKYADVEGVQSEVRWIVQMVDKPHLSMAISFALTAIERGLDLLDTGRFLPAIRAGKPFSDRQGKRPLLAKTAYFVKLAKSFPALGPKPLASRVFNNAPMGDNGAAPFYFDAARNLIDRDTGKAITIDYLAGQISKAKQRHASNKKDSRPSVLKKG